MKILLTCDPEIPVPPINYGGVERLVDGLVEEYTRLGHDVYLLANSQSTSSYAKQIIGWPSSKSRGAVNVMRNAFMLKKVCNKLKPDVVHSFSRLLFMYPMFLTSKMPFLQTYGRFISTKSTFLASIIAGKKLHFTLLHVTCLIILSIIDQNSLQYIILHKLIFLSPLRNHVNI